MSAKEQLNAVKRVVELGVRTVSDYAQYENTLARRLADL